MMAAVNEGSGVQAAGFVHRRHRRLETAGIKMVLFWIGLGLFSIVGASYASRRAVTSALRITESINISPALVGVTVLAIGTDLPEIANSLVSSASDHGDINVGDSMGSAVTQVTLVLGLLCLASSSISANRNFVISVGLAAVFSSVTVWILVRDGALGHSDGLILVLLWIVGTTLLGHGELGEGQATEHQQGRVAFDFVRTVAWLGVVGAFAIALVQSFLEVADRFGVPEFIGSFVALSIGTSLPELMVDWTAIRRGASAMAVGDIFGSSFVDATLSIGIGPLVFGSSVSSGVTVGVALAAAGILGATVLVARTRSFDRRLGFSLLAVYAIVQGTATVLEF